MDTQFEISKRLVLVNSASTLVRRIASMTVLLWLFQYLVKRIDKDEYALYPVLMVVVNATPVLTTIMVAGLGRYVTEAYAQGDSRRITQIVSSIFPKLALGALGLAILGAVLTWKVDSILTVAPEYVHDARIMLALLFSSAALRVLLAPFVLGFYVRQRFLARNLIGLGAEFVRISLLLILIMAIGPRVLWVITAMVSANLLELLVVAVVSRRLLPALRLDRTAIHKEVARPVLAFGGWTVLGKLTAIIRDLSDPLILNKLATSTDVNSFHLGSRPDVYLRQTYLAAGASAEPVATALAATDQLERLQVLFLRFCRYSLWTLLVAAVPLVVFRQEFYALYLDEKLPELPTTPLVMTLLLARIPFIFPNATTGMMAVARARIRAASIRALGLELANLALTLYLVGVHGMGAVGCAASSLTIAILGSPLLFWTLGLDLTELRWRPFLTRSLAPGLVPALVAAPIWLAARSYGAPTRWSELLILGAIGGLAYGVALFAFALRPEDRKDLRSFLRRLGASQALS